MLVLKNSQTTEGIWIDSAILENWHYLVELEMYISCDRDSTTSCFTKSQASSCALRYRCKNVTLNFYNFPELVMTQMPISTTMDKHLLRHSSSGLHINAQEWTSPHNITWRVRIYCGVRRARHNGHMKILIPQTSKIGYTDIYSSIEAIGAQNTQLQSTAPWHA